MAIINICLCCIPTHNTEKTQTQTQNHYSSQLLFYITVRINSDIKKINCDLADGPVGQSFEWVAGSECVVWFDVLIRCVNSDESLLTKLGDSNSRHIVNFKVLYITWKLSKFFNIFMTFMLHPSLKCLRFSIDLNKSLEERSAKKLMKKTRNNEYFTAYRITFREEQFGAELTNNTWKFYVQLNNGRNRFYGG